MIYDCFLYYDEDMLLEIRLNTLADVVDRFVIVESTHTFTGKKEAAAF
ncbi:Glycosyltransferase family 17 [Enterobacter asburiae]|uniref:Glycosyltransferase family 17 n=1 Tax=Enterobacter asburiae TaxID=61645 RepID=A0A376FBQ8_ENTAS|nr:Glycosyltransferase family 17 [Enterobacter asburiae]